MGRLARLEAAADAEGAARVSRALGSTVTPVDMRRLRIERARRGWRPAQTFDLEREVRAMAAEAGLGREDTERALVEAQRALERLRADVP